MEKNWLNLTNKCSENTSISVDMTENENKSLTIQKIPAHFLIRRPRGTERSRWRYYGWMVNEIKGIPDDLAVKKTME